MIFYNFTIVFIFIWVVETKFSGKTYLSHRKIWKNSFSREDVPFMLIYDEKFTHFRVYMYEKNVFETVKNNNKFIKREISRINGLLFIYLLAILTFKPFNFELLCNNIFKYEIQGM